MDPSAPHPPVTIAIPVKYWNQWVIESVQGCLKLDYPSFEVWLLPDHPPPAEYQRQLDALQDPRIKVVYTGPMITPRQRNVAIEKSPTDIIAFTDSDAYPQPDWLSKAVPLLQGDIGVVAGPNVTPPEDPLPFRVAGNVMRSLLGFGGGYIRHTPCRRQFVTEMPTCNMVFRRIPGVLLPGDLYTGDDMVFCADIRAHGKKILYDPAVVVYHHRRRVFRPFLRQFYLYGLYKGGLFHSAHEVAYLWNAMPAALVLYLAVALLMLAAWPGAWLTRLGLLPAAIYLALVLAESVRTAGGLAEFILNIPAFLGAHLSYGIGFLVGLVHPSSMQKTTAKIIAEKLRHKA